ncbi:hypothetical protein [Gillisia marina]|uniref:hypothetical protein n=1 Tax=Gillisia marina TaxID=1167637 RepID=UPI000683122E|nr:hypothetical protein [Gillisia marina]
MVLPEEVLLLEPIIQDPILMVRILEVGVHLLILRREEVVETTQDHLIQIPTEVPRLEVLIQEEVLAQLEVQAPEEVLAQLEVQAPEEVLVHPPLQDQLATEEEVINKKTYLIL